MSGIVSIPNEIHAMLSSTCTVSGMVAPEVIGLGSHV